ncbi:hypothetical protein [Roseateles albus]|uniref:Uncharacterized protein n=1 Tax=Roseateles albus TaxID=2987525 RepID=A0ABT5KFN9_9BURK|nr:hypothetical protein [Roseateles albus]MDC8772743.1 hypothetical protein [Roseateles albus]
MRATEASGGVFSLAANSDVCREWELQNLSASGTTVTFKLNPFELLSKHGFQRTNYAESLFNKPDEDDPFFIALVQIRQQFKPDLVIMTAQNAIAKFAFDEVKQLFIEQAPLPRLGHLLRTSIDPEGHQQYATLECYSAQIRALALTPKIRREATQLLEAVRAETRRADPRCAPAQAALHDLRKHGRIALLVTQPMDAVTYEGAYKKIEMENLIYSWASSLPPGWIGVPTYHAGERLSTEMERSLSAATDRLKFLPDQFSQGLTEPLLDVADGMVTISSTSAMTGLLFGKLVVVTGKSPFSAWCENDPTRLNEVKPLTTEEAVSTFCFLTNRFSYRHDMLMAQPQRFSKLLKLFLTTQSPAKWLLDIKDWDIKKASSLFEFRACDSLNGLGGAPCERRDLRQQLAALTSEFNSVKSEWHATIEIRNRLDIERNTAICERDSIHSEWASAVNDRDRLLNELNLAKMTIEDFEKKITTSVADRDKALNESMISQVRLTSLISENAALLTDAKNLKHQARLEQEEMAECGAQLAQVSLHRDALIEQLYLQKSENNLLNERVILAEESKLAERKQLEDRLVNELNIAKITLSDTQRLLEVARNQLTEATHQAQLEKDELTRNSKQVAQHRDTLHDQISQLQSENILLNERASLAEEFYIAELRASKDRIEYQLKQIDIAEQQANRFNETNSILTEKLAVIERKYKCAQSKWMNMIATYGVAISKLLLTTSERDAVRKRLAVTSLALEELKESSDAYANEVRAARLETATIENRLTELQNKYDACITLAKENTRQKFSRLFKFHKN